METTMIKKESMNAVVKMLPKDAPRPALQCIHITDNGTVMATDSYKLGVMIDGAEGGAVTFIPPHTKKYNGYYTMVGMKDNELVLADNGAQYQVTALDSDVTYPKFDKILDKFDDEAKYNAYSERFDIKQMKDILDSMLAAGEKSVTIHTVIDREKDEQVNSSFFSNDDGSLFYMLTMNRWQGTKMRKFDEVIKRVLTALKGE